MSLEKKEAIETGLFSCDEREELLIGSLNSNRQKVYPIHFSQFFSQFFFFFKEPPLVVCFMFQTNMKHLC